MPATELPFSDAEFSRRLEKVRKEMRERDIDVLFVEDPANMAQIINLKEALTTSGLSIASMGL